MNYFSNNQNMNTIKTPQELRKERQKKRIAQSLSLIGAGTLIALGMWGATWLIQSSPAVFGAAQNMVASVVQLTTNFRSAEDEVLAITSDNTLVHSNEPFILSWTHTGSVTDGVYKVSYQCDENITMSTDSGNTNIPCDTKFTITDTSIELTPILKNSRFQAMPITVYFTKDDGTELEDTVLFVVETNNTSENTPTDNSDEQETPTTPTAPTPNQTPGDKTEQTIEIPRDDTPINGKVDLVVRVLKTGILNSDTNEFTEKESILVTDRGGIFFEVINLGTKTSEKWKFNTVLPTTPAYTFNSDEQEQLAPGDRIEFTLGFDNVVHETEGTITINIDPGNTLDEVTRDNNTTQTIIKIIQ